MLNLPVFLSIHASVRGLPDLVQIPERAGERGGDREQADEREEKRDEPSCEHRRGAARGGEGAGLFTIGVQLEFASGLESRRDDRK